LDDLLRRARELASWISCIFEPTTDRLTREIAEARKRKSFSPADAAASIMPTYHPIRRMTP